MALLASAGFGVALIAAAVLGITCMLAIQSSWVAAVGLAPVLLVPIGGMETTTAGGVPIALFLAFFTLLYGSVAFVANRDSDAITVASLAPLAVIVLAGLAQQQFSIDSLSSSFLLAFVWIGAFAIGCAASIRLDTWRPIAWLMIGLASIAILELLLQEPVWNRLVGDMLFSSNDSFIRSRSTFGQPLVAGVIFAAMAVWFWSRRGRLAIAATFLCAIAATLSASRSAAIVFAVGAIVTVIQGGVRINKFRAAVGTLLTILLVVAVYSLVPNISDSLNQRANAETDNARSASLSLLRERLNSDPLSLLTGSGFRSTGAELRRSGGNFGINAFDNQYMTLAYEIGIAALLAVCVLICVAISKTSAESRIRSLPAFAGVSAALLAFDGLYWFSAAAVFWFFFGDLVANRRSEDVSHFPNAIARSARGAA